MNEASFAHLIIAYIFLLQGDIYLKTTPIHDF